MQSDEGVLPVYTCTDLASSITLWTDKLPVDQRKRGAKKVVSSKGASNSGVVVVVVLVDGKQGGSCCWIHRVSFHTYFEHISSVSWRYNRKG